MSAAERGRGMRAPGRLLAPKSSFRLTSNLAQAIAFAVLNLVATSALPAGAGLPGAPVPVVASEVAVRGEAGLSASITSARTHPMALTGRIEISGSLDAAAPSGSLDPGTRSGVLGTVGHPTSFGSAGRFRTLEWQITANPNLRLIVSDGSQSGQTGWQVSSQPFGWALEEAYLVLRQGGWVLSAGRERMPLEVARLSLPFSIEPVDGELRLGRWGIGLARRSGMTRLRLAALEDRGHLAPAASLRWEGGRLVFEGHALMPQDRRQVTAGLTASGLVGDLVAYGEVWRVPEWRYVGGLSGFWGDTLWALEAGRASPAPGQPVRRLVAAQFAWQRDGDVAWSLTQYAFLDEDNLRGQLVVDRVLATGSHEARLFAFLSVGPEPPAWSVGASYRWFWGTGSF